MGASRSQVKSVSGDGSTQCLIIGLETTFVAVLQDQEGLLTAAFGLTGATATMGALQVETMATLVLGPSRSVLSSALCVKFGGGMGRSKGPDVQGLGLVSEENTTFVVLQGVAGIATGMVTMGTLGLIQ